MSVQCLGLTNCFARLEDPRIERTKGHLLGDILTLAVLAVIAGAEGWEDIEDFGRQKHVWLKQYLELPNGIPSHDTIARVFRALRPGEFQGALAEWFDSLPEHLGLRCIPIDGKTLRRSHDRKTMKSALHLVCAWCLDVVGRFKRGHSGAKLAAGVVLRVIIVTEGRACKRGYALSVDFSFPAFGFFLPVGGMAPFDSAASSGGGSADVPGGFRSR